MCAVCSDHHKALKLTRDHNIVKHTKLAVRKCGPCRYQNTHVDAKFLCIECRDDLCTVCSEQHKLMKLTHSHTLVDYSAGQERHCGQCAYRNKQSLAKFYCNECDEDLCVTCCEQHKIIKLTRNHILAELPTVVVRKCGQCEYENKQIEAKFYCQECDEDLCGTCSEQHRMLKLTRNHILLEHPNPNPIQFGKKCDQCEFQNTHSEAKYYCHECDENLCDNCSEQHKMLKLTRSHKLNPVLSAPYGSCR